DAPGRARRRDGRLEHRHDSATPARQAAEELTSERQIPETGRPPREAVIRRQLAMVEQMPDVLERATESEVDGVIAAVDETPGLTVDEGEHRLGNGHVLEAPGRARSPGIDVTDARRIDELTEGDETHQTPCLDDRDVTEVPLQHLLEGVGDAVGRCEGE